MIINIPILIDYLINIIQNALTFIKFISKIYKIINYFKSNKQLSL